MTSAPANLLAARRLLIDNLDIDEDTVRDVDLEPGEVGIVGNAAHRGGYHCGSDRVVTNDYSVVESSRDKAGLTLYASALDVGMFEVRVAGKVHNLASFSIWCVAQCKANTPDSRDIREIIYSPDGRTVKRWDRLGKRSSGDSSHIYHTHFSYFRDSTKAGRDQRPLFRRYLTTIGLLEDDDMTPEELRDRDIWPNPYGDKATNPTIALGTAVRNIGRDTDQALAEVRAVRAGQAAILAAVQGLDTKAVLAAVEAVAAEERARDAELVELIRAKDSGELTAEQVLTKLRDLLPAGEPANPTQ